MSARRNGVIGLAVVAAAAASAYAAERAVMRRARGGDDPDKGQAFSLPDATTHSLPSHDGGTINTIEVGDGPTIVLSHGVTLSVRTWVKQLEFLPKRGFRTIAFDHRGHGDSEVGEHGHAIENLARDVRSVVEGLDLRDAVLVGHSMGGVAVQAFMVMFPEIAAERVAGIVLLSTLARTPMSGHERLAQFVAAAADRGPDPGGLMERKDLGYLLARVGFGREAQPAHIELTRQMILDCPVETRRDATRALMELDLVDRLRLITVPTLIISGTADLITPPAESRRIHAEIPHARFESVPGGGHMLMFERTALVDDLITDFAKQVQGRAASVDA
jgi:pimeloyl-ACP methyl ester carboxylesterase